MTIRFVALGVALLWAASAILAQESAGRPTSLGELARQERARRMKVMQEKSVRLWSNENIPRRPAGEGLTAAAGISATPTAPAPEAAPTDATPPAASAEAPAPGGPGEVHDEAYYRKRMSELRARLETHQRQLAVLQQRQSQGRIQYYPDPNQTLLQEYSRSDINKLNDEIVKKQQEIAADEQAIEDLQTQLRREGHPPGWLR